MIPADGVLIVGAGLTGLSCAYHLGGGRVLEREGEVGGLCRSYRRDGFTFDYTGHLLHLRDAYAGELVTALAPGPLAVHRRRARIMSHGRLTKYPFQANLWGLPREVVEECLEGLEEAEEKRGRGPEEAEDFLAWITATFGRGIARHFMVPYNLKLWRTPLEEMTTEWVAGLVPIPSLEDARKGAADPRGVVMGYNATFLYPEHGGIEAVPRALAARVPRIHINREVVAVDLERRKAVCRDGSEYHWEALVSTMPLPLLVRALRPAPPEISRAAEALRYVSVWDVNLAVARERVSDAHWIYFPEDRFPFYRAGFPGNFSPGSVPPGASSLYVEVSHRPGEGAGGEETAARCLDGLGKCGILSEDDRVIFADPVRIPFAYAVFDRHRREALPVIKSYLEEKGIYVAGRYGAWEYYSMEEAVLAGRAAAARVTERHGK